MKYLIAAAFGASALAAPAHAFDGVTFRVEAHGGYDRIAVGGGGENGAMYGIALGVDVPIGSTAFIGFEGGADLSSIKDCVSNFAVFGDRYCQKAKRDLSAVARLGADVGGGFKLYLLGGYSNARIAETYTGPLALSGAANGDGYRVGAGTEVRIGKSAYTKLEYRYSNYESGYSRHQVVAGIGLGL